MKKLTIILGILVAIVTMTTSCTPQSYQQVSVKKTKRIKHRPHQGSKVCAYEKRNNQHTWDH